MAIIGTNVKVEVQQTLGGALAVTGLTKANPGVATSTAHGLANGDVVVFAVPGGMVQLDGQAVRVANVTANTVELEGVDTTNFSTWSTGSMKRVTAWQTLASAQNISAPSPTPNKIDITTLIDIQKQYAYGLPDAPDGRITALFNPGGVAEGLINAATNTNTPLAFRVTFAGGQKTVFNANVSGGAGFDMQSNAAATAGISFTPVRNIIHYAT